MDAVDLDVVAGVRDDAELLGTDGFKQPASQLGAARATREQDYQSASGRPVILIPAWVL
jgi:hypothetical protein